MAAGVIYILSNPSFPEYVKIGYTDNLDRRLSDLNRSAAVPFAFRVVATYETPHRLTDVELHRLIDTLNPDLRAIDTVNGKKRTKEFYVMSEDDACTLLEAIAKISGTEKRFKRIKPSKQAQQDAKTASEVRNEARRPAFKFSMVGIKPGEQVVFLKDPSVVATVLDDKHIEYDGETTSLSTLAARLLGQKSVAGPQFFTYNGRVLADMRRDAE